MFIDSVTNIKMYVQYIFKFFDFFIWNNWHFGMQFKHASYEISKYKLNHWTDNKTTKMLFFLQNGMVNNLNRKCQFH